jgi:hypothetical protein
MADVWWFVNRRYFGERLISRARATQTLDLLRLDAEVQEMVVRLADPLTPGSLTERRLRGLSSRSAREQRKELEILLSNR